MLIQLGVAFQESISKFYTLNTEKYFNSICMNFYKSLLRLNVSRADQLIIISKHNGFMNELVRIWFDLKKT